VGTLYGSNPRGHEWCVPNIISSPGSYILSHTLNWLLSSNSLFFPRLKNFTFLIYPVTLWYKSTLAPTEWGTYRWCGLPSRGRHRSAFMGDML